MTASDDERADQHGGGSASGGIPREARRAGGRPGSADTTAQPCAGIHAAPTRRESAPRRPGSSELACHGARRATPRAARVGDSGAWSSVLNRADKSGWAARAIDRGSCSCRAGRECSDVRRHARTLDRTGCGRTGCGKLAADRPPVYRLPLSPYVQLEYTTALPVGRDRPARASLGVTPCWPASFCRNMRSSARRAGVGLEPAARLCRMIRGGRMPQPREQLT